jgi:hypothetical protein
VTRSCRRSRSENKAIQERNLGVMQFVTIRVIGVVTALVVPLFMTAVQVQSQTQAEMNAEAHADFVKADADLTRLMRRC